MDDSVIVGLFLAIAALLVAVGGLLAAADSALSVLSRQDLLALADDARFGTQLRRIAEDPGAHVNAVNFVRIVVETTAAVLVTLAFAIVFADAWWWTLLVAVVIMTGASFVLVGSSPRAVGRVHARSLIRFAAPVVRAVRIMTGPLADLLVAIGDRVTPGRPRTVTFASEQQLLSMVDEAAELDVLEEEDRELIHSIFEFGDTVVREVMVPRTDMVTLEAATPIAEALERFLERGVSRIPVIGEDADEVLGVLTLRDAVRVTRGGGHDARLTAADVARPALFVPESQKADALLKQMQREFNHIALVIDEYGGVAGLVTMEDLIEELVGDIADEYDRHAPDVVELGDGRWRVKASYNIEELGDLFGLEIEDDDVDSVGGLLAKQLGRLPVQGAVVETNGLRLTAERVEGRRRRLVSVVVEPTEPLLAAEDAFADGRGRDREGAR